MPRSRPLKILLMLAPTAVLLGLCAPPATARSRPQVIRLIWIQMSIHTTATRASWTSRLKNETPQFGKPAGATVGSELGFSDSSRASGVITLPGGVLQYTGKTKRGAGKAGAKLSITSGSGAYSGAKGSYTLFGGDKQHPYSAILVLRLQYR